LNLQSYKEKYKALLQDKHFGFVLKGSLSTALSLFFVQGLRFLTGIIIARYYGAKVSGQLTLVVTLMSMFAIVANFGIKDALQKLIPEYREKFNMRTAYQVFLKGNILIAVFSSVCMLLMYATAHVLSVHWNEPELEWCFKLSGVFLVFFVLSDLNYFSLRALLKVHVSNMLLVIGTVIRMAVLLVITYFFFNIYNPIHLHWWTLCLLPWLLSLIPVYKYFKKPAAQEAVLQEVKYRQILHLAFPMLLTYLSFFLTISIDVFILKFYKIPTEQIGIFKTCINISTLASAILISLNTTIQPKITQLYYSDKKDEIARLTQRSSKLMFWLSLPVFIVFLLGSKYVMWLYGNEFIAGALSLSILAVGQIINTACGPIAQFLNATGYHHSIRNLSFLAVAVNVLLNFLLVPLYGIEGAAWANAINVIVWNVAGSIYIKRKFGFHIFYFPFLSSRK
jgi:O-antigen/teichoic acid export membrane protein